MTRILAQLGVAHLILLLAGPLWRVFPFEVIAPMPAIAFAVFFGASPRERLPVALFLAVTVGYLADVLAGGPRGFLALAAGLVCLTSRLATARLLVRGRLFIFTFVLVAAIGASALLLLERLYLGAAVGRAWRELTTAGGSALLTAALGPPIFRLLGFVHAAFARTHREREALREGYLS